MLSLFVNVRNSNRAPKPLWWALIIFSSLGLKWIPCLPFRWMPSATIINSSTWSSWIVSCASKLNGLWYAWRAFFCCCLSVCLYFGLGRCISFRTRPSVFFSGFVLVPFHSISLSPYMRSRPYSQPILIFNASLYNAYRSHSSAKINSSQLICTDNIAFRLSTFVFFPRLLLLL